MNFVVLYKKNSREHSYLLAFENFVLMFELINFWFLREVQCASSNLGIKIGTQLIQCFYDSWSDTIVK